MCALNTTHRQTDRHTHRHRHRYTQTQTQTHTYAHIEQAKRNSSHNTHRKSTHTIYNCIVGWGMIDRILWNLHSGFKAPARKVNFDAPIKSTLPSLAWPDPIRPGAYRLEIISRLSIGNYKPGAYNLQSISAWAKRVWSRETRLCQSCSGDEATTLRDELHQPGLIKRYTVDNSKSIRMAASTGYIKAWSAILSSVKNEVKKKG